MKKKPVRPKLPVISIAMILFYFIFGCIIFSDPSPEVYAMGVTKSVFYGYMFYPYVIIGTIISVITGK